jgi:ferredoxin
MAYVIVAKNCIGCGSCVHFCICKAIDYVGEICEIDQSKCDAACGGACIEYCPIDDTIVEVPQTQEA